jgi:heme-degrading monooxygenase HmoA
MFVRNVSVHLKPSMMNEYTKTFQNDVLPLLRKQKGFQNVVSFGNPTGLDVTTISLWDTRENAELYGKNSYPEAIRLLDKVIDGTPRVRSEEVIHSTFMSAAEPVAAHA